MGVSSGVLPITKELLEGRAQEVEKKASKSKREEMGEKGRSKQRREGKSMGSSISEEQKMEVYPVAVQ